MVEINFIADFLGVATRNMREGFTYLGFKLKPCGYTSADWRWLVDKMKSRIHRWSHRWLSLGGRFVLIQAVLVQFIVYWGHLFYFSEVVVGSINAVVANFLWSGATNNRKIHLVKLEVVSMPTIHGGWDLMDVRSFSNALFTKYFWRVMNSHGTWSNIMKAKYNAANLLTHIF